MGDKRREGGESEGESCMAKGCGFATMQLSCAKANEAMGKRSSVKPIASRAERD